MESVELKEQIHTTRGVAAMIGSFFHCCSDYPVRLAVTDTLLAVAL
jgi:hypothetical protein